MLLIDDAGSKLKMAAGRFIDKLRLKVSRSLHAQTVSLTMVLLKIYYM